MQNEFQPVMGITATIGENSDVAQQQHLPLRVIDDGTYLWFVAEDVIAIWGLSRGYSPYHAFRSIPTDYKTRFTLVQTRAGEFSRMSYKRSMLCIRQDVLIEFLLGNKHPQSKELAHLVKQYTAATVALVSTTKEIKKKSIEKKGTPNEALPRRHTRKSLNIDDVSQYGSNGYPTILIQQTAGSNELLRTIANGIASYITSSASSRLDNGKWQFAPYLYLPVFDLAFSKLIEDNKAWVREQSKLYSKPSKKSKKNIDNTSDQTLEFNWCINQINLNLIEISKLLFPFKKGTATYVTRKSRTTWIRTFINLLNNYKLFHNAILGDNPIIEYADSEMDADGNITIVFSYDVLQFIQTSRFLKPLELPVNLYFFSSGRGRVHPYSFIANRSIYIHFRMNKNLHTREHIDFTLHNFLVITCIPDYTSWRNSSAGRVVGGKSRWFERCVRNAFASAGLYTPHYERTFDVESIVLDNHRKTN